MPPGIGYPDEQELTNSAIDSLLDEQPRKKKFETRDLSGMGQMAPIPNVPGPTGPQDPIVSTTPNIGPEALSRETSIDTGVVTPRVGAQQPGGSPTPTPVTSLTPPTGELAPKPPAPTVAPDVGTGVTSPRASGDRTSGFSNPRDAYNAFTGMVDPNASKEDMEAAIEAAFGSVPGYQKAYKESVKINGQWYDLVNAYGSPRASFQGLMAKKDGAGAGFLGGGEDGGFGMGEIDDASRLDAIMASIDAMARGEGSPLTNQKIEQLLGQTTGGATPASVTPLVQQPRPMARARRPLNTQAIESLLEGL